MIKNEVRTIRGAALEMSIVVADLTHILLHGFADDRSIAPLAYSIVPLTEIGKVGAVAHFVNITQVTPAAFRELGLDGDYPEVVADLFYKGDGFSITVVDPSQSLESYFLLPESVFVAFKWLRAKGKDAKGSAQRLNLNEAFLNSVKKLYRDHWVLIKTPGRIVIHPKEKIFEVAYRVPSETTNNKLWVAWGTYPLLQSGVEKNFTNTVEAMLTEGLKVYGQSLLKPKFDEKGKGGKKGKEDDKKDNKGKDGNGGDPDPEGAGGEDGAE
jgi:hypothetical protein